MELITVWVVHGDSGDDRSIGPVIGYRSTQSSAENAAKGKGWYGGNGRVTSAKALRIGKDVWLLAQPAPIDLDGEQAKADEELRVATLATLSDEQKRVLGIKS